MPSTFRWAAAAVGIIVAALATRALGDANSEFEERRDESRKKFENLISDMPALEDRGINGVFHIAVENKAVVIRTTLKNSPDEGFARLKVIDLGITALVRVGGIAPAATQPARPVTFQFNAFDYERSDRIVTLAVCVQPAFCNLSRISNFPSDEFEHITFTQWSGENLADGANVQLTVNAVRAGAAVVNIDLHAPDFFSFNRLHPAESDLYLRPMLRDMKQESAFAPDPLIAWQVFAELWHPDPAINRQVEALLPGLKDNDFRTRSQAQADLEKLGSNGAGVLMHLDRQTLTAEQNARIDLVLVAYPQLPRSEARQLRSDARFLVDCLFSNELALRKAALKSLQEAVDPAIAFAVDASPETRATAIDTLREKLLAHNPKR